MLSQSLSSIVQFGQLVGDHDDPPSTGRGKPVSLQFVISLQYQLNVLYIAFAAKVSKSLCRQQHTSDTQVGDALTHTATTGKGDSYTSELGRSKRHGREIKGRDDSRHSSTVSEHIERHSYPTASDLHGLKHAFVNFVIPGDDGYATRSDVKTGLKKMLGNNANEKAVEQMLDVADPDKSGYIDFSSFKHGVLHTQPQHWNNTSIPIRQQDRTEEDGKMPAKSAKMSQNGSTGGNSRRKNMNREEMERKRKKETLKKDIRNHLLSQYGSDANATRKFFLNLPRTSSGNISIAGATKGLRNHGINVSEDDLALLFHDSGAKASANTRLTFDSFAKVVEDDDPRIRSQQRNTTESEQKETASPGLLARVKQQVNDQEVYPSNAFLKLDKDRDGFLTSKDVETGLNDLGVQITEKEANDLMSSLNAKDGVLDYSSFVSAFFSEREGGATIQPDTGSKPWSTRSNTECAADKDMLWEQTARNKRQLSSAKDRKDTSLNKFGEFTDEHGIYTTTRDIETQQVSAEDRFYDFFYRDCPHLHQYDAPRDVHGTPAPFLDRRRVKTKGRNDLKKETVREKQGNEVLRRVATQLASKGSTKSLFMKLNSNRDSKVDSRELKLGLAKLGVPLTDNEFNSFMRRIDTDANGCISYSEFARAVKGDDPEADPIGPRESVKGYRPHKYNSQQWDDSVDQHRVNLDSRGVLQSLIAEGSAPSMSLDNARMANILSDRITSRTSTTQDAFLGLSRGSGRDNSIPADPSDFKKRLQNLGVTVSQREAEAFLEPVLASGQDKIDYQTFTNLARPRGFLDMDAIGDTYNNSGATGNTVTIGKGAIGGTGGVGFEVPVSGANDDEGLGRFGQSPGKIGKYGGSGEYLPASQYAFVRYANAGSDCYGNGDAVEGSSQCGAAYDEQKEIPVAGKAVSRPSRKGLIDKTHTKYRNDEVWGLLRSQGEARSNDTRDETTQIHGYSRKGLVSSSFAKYRTDSVGDLIHCSQLPPRPPQSDETSERNHNIGAHRRISFQNGSSRGSERSSDVSSLTGGDRISISDMKVLKYRVPPPVPPQSSSSSNVAEVHQNPSQREHYNRAIRASEPPRWQNGHWQKHHTSDVFYNTKYPAGSPHKRSAGKRRGRFNPA